MDRIPRDNGVTVRIAGGPATRRWTVQEAEHKLENRVADDTPDDSIAVTVASDKRRSGRPLRCESPAKTDRFVEIVHRGDAPFVRHAGYESVSKPHPGFGWLRRPPFGVLRLDARRFRNLNAVSLCWLRERTSGAKFLGS